MLPTTILKFVLAAAVGVTVTLGVGAAAQSGPKSTAVAGPATLYQVVNTGDTAVAFTAQSTGGTIVALQGPPPDQGIQLTSYTSKPATPTASTTRPAWVNPTGYPRVPPISQFDGGPLQGFNCTMASGAMLARLGYGIVTTGSQLRSLQPKQGQTGTNLDDVNTAVGKGWSVHFAEGALTPLQFRALIYAGAGAILQGIYGDLPVADRLQADFVDAHAIYVDGFRPPQGGQPAAYYVIDPIGHTWAGYRGAWLPAADIEAFAVSLGAGRMLTAWAFPGGLTPPANYPSLPPDAFPPSGPSASPSTEPSASVSPSGVPVASSAPTPPPLPEPSSVSGDSSGNIPIVVPVDVSVLEHIQANVGAAAVVPNFGLCLAQPIPASCPAGLPATYPGGASPAPVPTGPPLINLLYASVPQPGLVQVIFSGSGDASSLDFWRTDGSGAVQAADVVPALLGGQPVWLATFAVGAGSYGFSAGLQGAGVAGLSPAGSIKIGP